MREHYCNNCERVLENLRLAKEENEKLRDALKYLLSDTQHAEHNCGDDRCPVDYALVRLRSQSPKAQAARSEV